jgi:hypothetical protein
MLEPHNTFPVKKVAASSGLKPKWLKELERPNQPLLPQESLPVAGTVPGEAPPECTMIQ